MPDHLDHADLDPPRRAQMQLVPAMHLNPLAMSIRALPAGIWVATRARVAALKTCSIKARSPTRAWLACWGRAIKDAIGFGAKQGTGIHSQKDMLTGARQWGELHKGFSQTVKVNLAILEGFVQAGPPTNEEWRERQLRKALRCRFARQRVYRVEQRIRRLLETAIDPVTKFVQSVQVYLRNAPAFLV